MTHADTSVAAKLNATTWSDINEFALWLHRQHDVASMQRAALERIGQLITHRISMFDLIRMNEHGVPAYVDPASATMDAAALRAYYERYAAQDYTTWSFDLTQVNVYRDLDLVDVERRDATPIYREWMAPQGVYFGCTLTLAQDGTPLGSVTLFRGLEAGDFTASEMRTLFELGRHLSVRLAEMARAKAPVNGTVGATPEQLAQRHGLNPRETEVLELMLAGHTNREMAGKLFISESTVKKHVNAVYHKLGVKNRMGLANLMRTN